MAEGAEQTHHHAEIRLMCPSAKFGTVINATGIYRVRCTGKFCKGPEGTATFHLFDLSTGELLKTDQPGYRNPAELVGQGR